jgi:uncharacterized protein YjbI with pentapeptide repeats
MTGTARTPLAPRLPAALEPGRDLVLDDDEEWVGLHVEGDFAGVEAVDVSLAESRLAGVAFTGARLERLQVVDCVLESCDLSGALLDGAALTRVELRGCRLSGLVLSRARLTDVRLVDCRADLVNVRMATGERLCCEGSDLREADLYGTTLTQSALLRCNLTGAELSAATLAGTRLQGSVLDGVRGVEHLDGVVLDSAQAGPVGLALLSAHGIVVEDEDDQVGDADDAPS